MSEERLPVERLTTAMLLGILMMAAFQLKVRLSTFTPRYDAQDETGYFRAESAYQYRYARMIAQGQALPEVDRDGEYPEGVRPARELTPFMEYATGWSARLIQALAGPIDLRWFVILWVAAVSSLTIPAAYFLGLRLGGSRGLALAASAAYGLSWASQANVVGTYVFECFAFPLLAGGLACLAQALDGKPRRRRAFALAAGLLFASALASWHLARFFFGTLLAALAWLSWLRRERPQAQEALQEAAAGLVGAALAASLAVACLRETWFALSPAMVLGYALLAWHWLPRRRRAVVALGAAALAVSAWRSPDVAVYGHVYGYLAAKLRFGLARPADPARLPAAARSIWSGPADSPSPGFAFFSLFPLAGLLAPRAVAAVRRERAPETLSGPLVDVLLALYAAGTLMALRLMPFCVFFLCLAAARLPVKLARRPWLIALVLALAGLEGLKALAPASPFNPFIRLAAAFPDDERHPAISMRSERQVIGWLRAHDEGRPVLADVSFSAEFLAYAGAPVLVHPKFEAAGLRAKVAGYLGALFSGEDAFYAWCRERGAGLFVLTISDLLDETPDGPRYRSGSLRLRRDTAAYLLHFAPEKLKHFRLLYQNDGFRVFVVGAPGVKPPVVPPIYDLAQFNAAAAADGAMTLDVAGALARIRESRQKLFLARVYMGLGRPEEALDAYEASFKTWPADEGARLEYERARRSLTPAR